jgi:hypothetical protein
MLRAYLIVYYAENNSSPDVDLLVLVSSDITAFTPPAYQPCGLQGISTKPNLEEGLTLRCFQRLSRPDIATQRLPLA